MGDRNLEKWVTDELYGLLGFTESALASYVVSLGRKATSAAVLARQLETQGLPASQDTHRFAEQLIAWMPKASKGPSAYQERERKAAAFARANQNYSMLSDSEDELAEPPPAPTTAPLKSSKEKNLRRSKCPFVRVQGEGRDEEDGTTGLLSHKRRKRKWEEDLDDGGGELDEEEERERDQREKQEFEERLKARDEAKTRKIAEAKLSKEELEEIERRKYKTEEEKDALVPMLRDVSRQEYLKKREEQKLQELEDALKDEEFLFCGGLMLAAKQGQKLTAKEQKELEYKRKVYELARMRKKQEEEVNRRDHYHIPDSYDADGNVNQSSRYSVLTARYRRPSFMRREEQGFGALSQVEGLCRDAEDPEEDATPWKEQENWEAEQIRKANQKTGAKDRKSKAQEYDLVFEDQINFITDLVYEGTLDLDEEAAAEKEREAKKAAAKSEFEALQADRAALPIYPYRDELLKAVAEHQVLIIVGETGSGKTTQIPQYLHEAGYSKAGRIGCTQPRRVAAMSVAARVAQEVGCKLGNEVHSCGIHVQLESLLEMIGIGKQKFGMGWALEAIECRNDGSREVEAVEVVEAWQVGYSIRFEDCTSDKTVVKYMTDGMLLREFLGEPDLATYSVMMVDEAHERTLHTDVLFDAEKFSEYFDYAPIFRIPGRRYPRRHPVHQGPRGTKPKSLCEIWNQNVLKRVCAGLPQADYLHAAVVTTLQVHVTQPPGDVLIFLTGQEEIEAAEELLKQRTKGLGSKIGELMIAPIYANLPSDLQAKIFEPTPQEHGRSFLQLTLLRRRSPLTVLRWVFRMVTPLPQTFPERFICMYPGFCKQNSYNPRTGMASLVVTPVSKASAQQRAGRAGRTSPGKCFRLYTAYSFQHELEDNTIPEIQRTNLGNVVLMLKSLGINDLMNFDFMDPPPTETLFRALEQLYALGALNDKGELTKLGRRMAEFPLDPMMAKMIITSEKFKAPSLLLLVTITPLLLTVMSTTYCRYHFTATYYHYLCPAHCHYHFAGGAQCSEEVATICAMMSIGNSVFYRPKDKAVHADNAHNNFHRGDVGDHMALLNVYNAWAESGFSTQWCYENFVQVRSMKRARDIREQVIGLMERVEIELESNLGDHDAIRKSIAAGFFYNTARLQKNGSYRTVKNPQTVNIHPSSGLQEVLPRWVVYQELVMTSKAYMRTVSEIKPEWLIEIAPHYYSKKELTDESAKKMPKVVGRAAMVHA
eukprot:jgi/Botrbrau1/17544/Bobra.0864s0003.1